MAVRTTRQTSRLSLDRSIERMRKQLAELAPFLGKGKPTSSLEEFDLETERLIGDLLGQTSSLLHAYEYAELGEAAGLVNLTDEAPEGVITSYSIHYTKLYDARIRAGSFRRGNLSCCRSFRRL